jgi:hypothetical protein
MSTIQIKRGSGTSVPSSLADGELAINLDNGKLYFGSGSAVVNSFRFENLTAENYIVSSSVTNVTFQQQSGSTIFGDSEDDNHAFSGSITASSNISSSGTIIGGGLNINGTTTFNDGNITNVNQIDLDGFRADSATNVQVSLSTSGIDVVMETGDAFTINSGEVDADFTYFDSSENSLIHGDAGLSRVGISDTSPVNKLTVNGDLGVKTHITASGDISSSLAGTVSAGSGSYHILQGDTSQNTALFIDGSITASGDISASGDIIADGIKATLPTGTDNSVVVLDSDGFLKTDEVDSKIFDAIVGNTGGGNFGSDHDGKFVFIDDGDSNTLDPDSNLKNTTNGIIVEGFLSASNGITSSGAHIMGNISGSGEVTFGTPSQTHTHTFYGRIRTVGSDVTIGEGHISMSGNISGSAGSTGSFDHIITSTGSIEFRAGGSKIGDLKFDSTNGLEINDASKQPTKLKAGRVNTPILSGAATGDQSGSLYLSGSLTFRDNEAMPAVSASTLFVKAKSTDNAPDTDLRFSNSGLTPAFAWVTLDEEATADSSEYGFGKTTDVTSNTHNMIVTHDKSGDGVKIFSQIDGTYKVTGNYVVINGSTSTDVVFDTNVDGSTVHTFSSRAHSSVDPVERTQIYVGTINSGSFVRTTVDGTSCKLQVGSVLLVERLA